MQRQWLDRTGWLSSLLAGLVITAPAIAHPHVWVEASTQIVFDAAARVTGIRHTWIFDPAYSAYATMGFDMDRDGNADPDKLAELAESNLASLAETNYFTAVKVDGSPAALAPPEDYQASIASGRLILRFLLPLKTPIQPKELALHVGDPTFFTAFTLPQAADTAMLDGAPEACKASLNRPAESGSEDVKRLAQDISAALRGELDVPATVDSDPAGRITVICQQE
ncbi:DUF1007 family protein [Microvirga sp. GCM10011540]|uniref:DUF1007 family protein n=1 Tax=Microvirga sp. GCM10011540 TaxID=3317338 RepID=UPI003612237C